MRAIRSASKDIEICKSHGEPKTPGSRSRCMPINPIVHCDEPIIHDRDPGKTRLLLKQTLSKRQIVTFEYLISNTKIVFLYPFLGHVLDRKSYDEDKLI